MSSVIQSPQRRSERIQEILSELRHAEQRGERDLVIASLLADGEALAQTNELLVALLGRLLDPALREAAQQHEPDDDGFIFEPLPDDAEIIDTVVLKRDDLEAGVPIPVRLGDHWIIAVQGEGDRFELYGLPEDGGRGS